MRRSIEPIVVPSDAAVAPQKGIQPFGNPPAGDAKSRRSLLMRFVVPPNQKEIHMRLRLFRVLYLISTVTAFVVAAGAGRKFCGG
jgi:hypothetical protein